MKSKSKFAAVLAALLLFTLTACAGTPAIELPAPIVQAEPSPAVQSEAAEAEPTAITPAEAADEQLSQPEARPCVGTMLLSREQTDAFAAVTDEEICLWDAASGGQLIAVARFPYALSGAKDALVSCDFTDLDGDGNSDLTAEFSFSDSSTASLLWFYTDGGLVYNEEFSILPGEQSTAGTD